MRLPDVRQQALARAVQRAPDLPEAKKKIEWHAVEMIRAADVVSTASGRTIETTMLSGSARTTHSDETVSRTRSPLSGSIDSTSAGSPTSSGKNKLS